MAGFVGGNGGSFATAGVGVADAAAEAEAAGATVGAPDAGVEARVGVDTEAEALGGTGVGIVGGPEGMGAGTCWGACWAGGRGCGVINAFIFVGVAVRGVVGV